MPKNARCTFEQPYTELNDGLTQKSVRIIEYPNDIHEPTKIAVEMHLPPFVLTSFWQQMNLSEKDVYRMGNFLPDARFYWAAVLVSGQDINATALKPSYSHVSATCWSLRAEAIRTLINTHKVKFRSTVSNLDETSQSSVDHVPPLPSCELDESQIAAITKLLHPDLIPFQTNKIRGLFTYNGARWLPIRIERAAIWLQRATLHRDFERSNKRQKFGCVTAPFIVSTPDGEKYALVEDSILVSTRQC